jgi:hypothetical protein
MYKTYMLVSTQFKILKLKLREYEAQRISGGGKHANSADKLHGVRRALNKCIQDGQVPFPVIEQRNYSTGMYK